MPTKTAAIFFERTSKTPDNFVSIIQAAHKQSAKARKPVQVYYDEIPLIIDASLADDASALRGAKEAFLLMDIRSDFGLTTYGRVTVTAKKMHEHFNLTGDTRGEKIENLLLKAKEAKKFATGVIDDVLVVAVADDDAYSIDCYLGVYTNHASDRSRLRASNWPQIASAIRPTAFSA